MLRCGYTTGTCAALAAAAATRILLTGKAPETVSLMTAKGIPVEIPVEFFGSEAGNGAAGEGTLPRSAWAGARKDAGDDADVTRRRAVGAGGEGLFHHPAPGAGDALQRLIFGINREDGRHFAGTADSLDAFRLGNDGIFAPVGTGGEQKGRKGREGQKKTLHFPIKSILILQ